MNLQTIKSIEGKIEYVLLPIKTFKALRKQIVEQLKITDNDQGYDFFEPADYVQNPIAIARIKAGFTQEKLAKLMNVSQAYISRIEHQNKITDKILQKVKHIITTNS